ncbi:MAG: hypothetical protein JNL18_12240 [Planctomycetaceae bacterium]|nr:hypothetical protein [Planctomycetaceae bacterium]
MSVKTYSPPGAALAGSFAEPSGGLRVRLGSAADHLKRRTAGDYGGGFEAALELGVEVGVATNSFDVAAYGAGDRGERVARRYQAADFLAFSSGQTTWTADGHGRTSFVICRGHNRACDVWT